VSKHIFTIITGSRLYNNCTSNYCIRVREKTIKCCTIIEREVEREVVVTSQEDSCQFLCAGKSMCDQVSIKVSQLYGQVRCLR